MPESMDRLYRRLIQLSLSCAWRPETRPKPEPVRSISSVVAVFFRTICVPFLNLELLIEKDYRYQGHAGLV